MDEGDDEALRRAHEIYDRLMREMRFDLERRLRRDPPPPPRDLAARGPSRDPSR
jgi:hypothetical protein